MAGMMETLLKEKCMSLETYKKDGGAVKVPVWLVEIDGKLCFWTDSETFKVKRIRRNPKARVAPCDFRGNVHGDWFDAKAEVIEDPALVNRTRDALKKKYGWQRTLIAFINVLRGAKDRGVVIAVSPA